jgi:hypothetical protein
MKGMILAEGRELRALRKNSHKMKRIKKDLGDFIQYPD